MADKECRGCVCPGCSAKLRRYRATIAGLKASALAQSGERAALEEKCGRLQATFEALGKRIAELELSR